MSKERYQVGITFETRPQSAQNTPKTPLLQHSRCSSASPDFGDQWQLVKWNCHHWTNPKLVGWFQPIWKSLKNISLNWIISPGRGEKRKCLKPPPRKYVTSFWNLRWSVTVIYRLDQWPTACDMSQVHFHPAVAHHVWHVHTGYIKISFLESNNNNRNIKQVVFFWKTTCLSHVFFFRSPWFSLMSFTSLLMSACSVTSFTGQYNLGEWVAHQMKRLKRHQKIAGRKLYPPGD